MDSELFSLDDLDIVSLSTSGTGVASQTPSGIELRDRAAFTRADGSTGTIFEAILDTDATDTVYRGENGTAAWLTAQGVPTAKGFGRMTNLDVTTAHEGNTAKDGVGRVKLLRGGMACANDNDVLMMEAA